MKNTKLEFKTRWKSRFLFRSNAEKSRNVMRTVKAIDFLLLFCFYIVATGSISAQSVRLSLNIKDKPITRVLDEIEKQTQYRFYYNNKIVNTEQTVSVVSNNEDALDVLDKVLSPSNIGYEIKGNDIILTKGRNEDKVSTQPASKIIITGNVSDVKGNPMSGVTILIKGASGGTISDNFGNYSIKVPANSSTLTYKYLGYILQGELVGGRKVINITMQEDEGQLDEVVVVGYGTQKKESVIGAITTLSPKALQINQSASLSNALSGQIAGIIGVQRSGEPGYDASDFWIRGINTFGANSHPLVIVDGIERDLNSLSAEEIESFSVLKDATATAIYGVRGANGAIVINTKRGTKGKPRVSLKGETGISAPTQLPDYVDGAKYMEVVNAARALSNRTDYYSQDLIDKTRAHTDLDLYPDVNWIKLVTNDYATNSRVSMDVNGGSDNLRYRFIFGMFNETGIIKTDPTVNFDSQIKLAQYNVRSNVDMDLTPSTLFSISIGGYIINKNQPGSRGADILDWSMTTPPIVHPAQYSTGQFPKLPNRMNPWAMATQSGYVKNYDNSIQSVVSLEQDFGKLWEPLKGFKIKTIVSFDAYSWHQVARTKSPSFYIATGRDENGKLLLSLVDPGSEFLGFGKNSGGNRNMYFEVPITYDRTIAKDHHVSGLLLYNMKNYINADAGTAIDAFPYRQQGIAGRVTYDYKTKYFTEFNFGYNGSENFKKGYRFGFFPSVAAGWLVTNEDFMDPLKGTLDKLKVRGSYGKVGNDQITNSRRFGYLTTINNVKGYTFGTNLQDGYSGLSEGEFGIDNLTWETAFKSNLGVDVGLFHGFNMQIDAFRELRDKIFMQRKTIPETAGYQNMPYANFGKVLNQGFDASFDFNKQINKNWFLSFMGNITHAVNKIKEYDEPKSVVGTNTSRTNQGIYQNYGLVAERLFTEADFTDAEAGTLAPGTPIQTFSIVKPGDIKYKDVNGDGKIDTYDACPIGKPSVPETVFGFGFSAKYKNVDFGALFQGMTNVNFIISGSSWIPGSGDGSIGNILTNCDDRWTPENQSQNVFYPRLSANESENNDKASTWWLKDGSYLRLKNIELGYSIDRKDRKLPFKNVRFYLRGSNILTFSSFKLWDPELAGTGYRSYPASKVLSLGVDINL